MKHAMRILTWITFNGRHFSMSELTLLTAMANAMHGEINLCIDNMYNITIKRNSRTFYFGPAKKVLC